MANRRGASAHSTHAHAHPAGVPTRRRAENATPSWVCGTGDTLSTPLPECTNTFMTNSHFAAGYGHTMAGGERGECGHSYYATYVYVVYAHTHTLFNYIIIIIVACDVRRSQSVGTATHTETTRNRVIQTGRCECECVCALKLTSG